MSNVDTYLKIGKGVLDVAAKFIPEAALGEHVIDLILAVKAQTGMSTEEIIAQTDVVLGENEKMIAEDLIRLREAKE